MEDQRYDPYGKRISGAYRGDHLLKTQTEFHPLMEDPMRLCNANSVAKSQMRSQYWESRSDPLHRFRF